MGEEDANNEVVVLQKAEGEVAERPSDNPPAIEALQQQLAQLKNRAEAAEGERKALKQTITRQSAQIKGYETYSGELAEVRRRQDALARAALAEEGEEIDPPLTKLQRYQNELSQPPPPQDKSQKTQGDEAYWRGRYEGVMEAAGLLPDAYPPALSSVMMAATEKANAGEPGEALAIIKAGIKEYQLAANLKKAQEKREQAEQLRTNTARSEGAAGQRDGPQSYRERLKRGDPLPTPADIDYITASFLRK